MAMSTITVQYDSGSPATGTKVVLSFSSGGQAVGFTDKQGVASISHASTGNATIHAKGQKFGPYRMPGNYGVTLR